MTAPPGYRPKDADQIQRSLYGANKQIYDRVPIGKQFGVLGEGYDERIAPEPSQSTSISSQFPSYKYDSPLTPGMTPEDMARRAAMMNQIEQEMRDMGLINRPAVNRTGSPIDAGGIPTGGRSPGKTRSISGDISPPTYSGGAFNQENEIQQAAVDRAISAAISARDIAPKKTPTEPRDTSFSNSFVSSAAAATPGSVDLRGAGYGTFNVPDVDRDLAAPEDVPPSDMYNKSRIGTRIGSGPLGIADLSGERTSYTPGDYDAYRNEGSIVDGTSPSQGSESTAKTRSAAEAWENTPYGEPGVQARQRGPVEKFLQEKFPHWGVRGAAKGYGYVEDRRIAGMTPDERIAEMDRRAQMDRSRFKGSDGREDGIGSGGKNEPPRIEQAEKEAAKPKAKPKEDGRRPAIYYKWDLGVGVPSPTDSDYTLYLKYLQEKAAAKAGMAR
jgi:hypothetical protein